MTKEALSIGTASAKPGSKSFGSLRVGELSDGSPIDMPLILVNGAQSGPTLYLGAAIHANELTGVEIIRRIISAIDPQKLTGAIIAAPTQNPLAFRAKHPLTPYYEEKGDIIDMWQALPGNPDGDVTSIMAHVLVTEAMSKADYIIDLHAGFPSERYAVLPPPDNKKAGELARAFGMWLIEEDPPVEVKLFSTAKSLGNVAMCVELGHSGRLDEKYVTVGVRGVNNVMKYLGMIEGKPEPPEKEYVYIRNSITIRASRGGWLITEVEILQNVAKGQLLASIYDMFTFEKISEIMAPREGMVLRLVTYPQVNKGSRVVAIGY
ncbi:succinylglutamate desuccinylase/aspartoacylase family protein [Chloroflexota bacterium]